MVAETMREAWKKALDDSFYDPDDDEKEFMKVVTGIDDGEELRRHIISVQTEAFSVRGPLLVRPIFSTLTDPTASAVPVYPDLRILAVSSRSAGIS